MKETKNIKKPTYATCMGNGNFAAGVYGWFVCRNCGRRVQFMSSDGQTPPPPTFGGLKCPETSSGNHVWMKA